MTDTATNTLIFVTPSRAAAPTWRRLASPVGELLLVSDGEALCGLYLDGARYVPALPSGALADEGALDDPARQLEEYFAGTRTSFSGLRLAPVGTAFQRQVWGALAQIAYGTTATYGQIAATLGRPSASRAVGAANGRNPISIIVPCHRVIGANGTLTGYAGGLDNKATLLDLERRVLAAD